MKLFTQTRFRSPVFNIAAASLCAVLITGCANLENRRANITALDEFVDSADTISDPRINVNYSRWLADIDRGQRNIIPKEYSLGDSLPMIAGQLPGQKAINPSLFTEAAIEDYSGAQGVIVFVEDDQPVDLWDRVRQGFGLPHQDHPRIEADLRWFKHNQHYLDRVSERAERYLHYIEEEVERRGMPSEIALLPIVESAYQPFAYSHGRAAGIWQFIPSTGKLFGLKQNWWYDGRRDIVASTDAALSLLEQLHRTFNNDWLLALAAYNSGQGTVYRAIQKNKRKGLPTDFWSLDLPLETRGYVPKLIAISILVENPEEYGLQLATIPNEPYMARVETESQIDLALAAELADVSLEELYLLNPAYNRWATDPKGPHALMVPVANAESFAENLAGLSDDDRIRWERHTVRNGETLLQIAEKYRTSVGSIKDLNKIRGNMIRAGQSLVVPVSTKNLDSYILSAEQRLNRLQNSHRAGKSQLAYRVRRGDTLWDIARKFGVGVRVLAKWNGLAPRDTLKTGQKLVVWSKRGTMNASVEPAKFSPHASHIVTQKIRYKVRNGDSLALISRKFNVNINDLVRWNGISSRKYLQPGQKLTLYIDVTAQTGT